MIFPAPTLVIDNATQYASLKRVEIFHIVSNATDAKVQPLDDESVEQERVLLHLVCDVKRPMMLWADVRNSVRRNMAFHELLQSCPQSPSSFCKRHGPSLGQQNDISRFAHSQEGVDMEGNARVPVWHPCLDPMP
jgi:hypothetical protein